MATKNKQDQSTKLYWIATAFMLITAMPIGLVMIAFKLFETKKQGKPQVDYEIPLGAQTTTGSRTKSKAANLLDPMLKKASHRIKLGSVLTAFFALGLITCIGSALTWLPDDPMWFLQEIWFALCCTAVSGTYLFTGLNLRKKARRFRNYLSMIGSRQVMPVSMLAAAANVAPKLVRNDLEEMLDAGILTQGFLDHHKDQLILSSSGLSDPAPAKPSQKAAADPAHQENALLAEIKSVNDLVKNEKVSAQIDQIGVLTAKILDYEKSHPNAAPQLHSFLSYYLPTTLKILRAYGQLESQEVSGTNISAAMKRIEDMMDKVVAGFEKQLDQLYLGETMDITSDVEVLERMLAKDGLSDKGLTLKL